MPGGLLATVIAHLSTLYNNLIHAADSSIRPEKELAYLALVTSQDEQEEQQQQSPGDAQQLPSIPEASTSQQPVTSPMEIDGAGSAEHVVNKPLVQEPAALADGDTDMAQPDPPQAESQPMMATETKDGVTEIKAYKPPAGPPPPLPPRPQQKRHSTTYTGEMMFGKQHDVSEAMDNCLFQIEACVCSCVPRWLSECHALEADIDLKQCAGS